MLDYKHILLATDLSADAYQVGRIAVQLAKGTKAKLSVVHVREYTPIVYGGGEFSVPIDVNIEETLRRAAEQALHQFGEQLGIDAKDLHLVLGSPKKEIIHVAEELGVDLIVIGSHGRHGIDRLLGSTANAVLHIARCDVYAVRIKEEK